MVNLCSWGRSCHRPQAAEIENLILLLELVGAFNGLHYSLDTAKEVLSALFGVAMMTKTMSHVIVERKEHYDG